MLADTLKNNTINPPETFEKKLENIPFERDISELIKQLEFRSLQGQDYYTTENVPITGLDSLMRKYVCSTEDRRAICQHFEKYLEGVHVDYYNYDVDLLKSFSYDINSNYSSRWVFYWYDITKYGDSLPYPEINEWTLDRELDHIQMRWEKKRRRQERDYNYDNDDKSDNSCLCILFLFVPIFLGQIFINSL